MSALLGVLGGMGPLATVDFLGKLIAETPATRDAEHIPVVVYSVPQIPDRPRAILENGESPLPAMLKGIRTLQQAGATGIAIPCNTAHVKSNALEAAHTLAVRAALNLQAAGAQAVILACTEIPLALEHRSSDIAAICVDPTRALAQECVRWWRSTSG